MKLKQVLDESFPTGPNALKAKNHVVKHHAGKKSWSGDSNPYSDRQSFDLSVSPTHATRLGGKLKSSGWSHEEKKGQDGVHHQFTHADGGHVNIFHGHGNGTWGGKPYARVTVWGKKKAKTGSYSQYD